MELEPGQPVFVKEVQGNVWKTGTVDQPTSEPDSYWVRFPDNSILRRMRSIIMPRSQPSHFKLKGEQQPGNYEGMFHVHSSDSFNPANVGSQLPFSPMESVMTPSVDGRDSKVGMSTNPTSSTGTTQPSITSSESGSSPGVSTTPLRHSSHSARGIPPARFTPSKK